MAMMQQIFNFMIGEICHLERCFLSFIGKKLINPDECPQLIFLPFPHLFFLASPQAPSTHETLLQQRSWMTALFPVTLFILCYNYVILVTDSMITQLLYPPVVDK